MLGGQHQVASARRCGVVDARVTIRTRRYSVVHTPVATGAGPTEASTGRISSSVRA